MGLQYFDIKRSETVLRSLTGLTEAQFDELLTAFEHQYQNRYSKYNLRGQLRQRSLSKKKNDKLPQMEDKLLFILTYVKNYPVQLVQASMFDMTQPQCNTWIKLLMPLLNDALDELGMLPARNVTKANSKLQDESQVIIDGTERPIQRPKDYEVQKEYYSGKKNGIP